MKFYWSLAFVLLLYLSFLEAQETGHEVQLGSTVNLQCKPSSTHPSAPTSYQWFGPQGQHLGSNIHLIIPNFAAEHQGTYTCRATQIIDGQPASSSKSILVRLKVGIEYPQVSAPQVYNTFASGILFLLCKSSKGLDQEFKFEWITPTGEKHPTPSYFKNQINLYDAGRYTCRMTRLSDNTVAEGYTMVSVNQLPIKVEKISGSMSMGQTVSMRCEIDKVITDNKVYSQFSYTWENPSNQIISNNQIAEIRLDDPSKFGVYKCKVSAVAMNPPYSQSQSVEIRYAQDSRNGGDRNSGGQTVTTYTGSFTSNPTTVRYFQPLELTCNINPPLADVSYQIIFNNQFLTSSNRYSIARLGKENLGMYQCNIQGKDFRNGHLVNLKATFTLQPEFRTGSKIELSEPPGPQIFVRNGDKRELHCEIPANAGLQGKDAVWYFNGTEITPNDFTRYNLQVLPRLYVSIVVLRNIQSNNEGKYECRVRGEMKEAYILVMARSRNIEVNPADETRRVGDGRPVEFHCRIDGYQSKNRDIVWTFISKETGQVTSLDSRWRRIDDQTADETSFVIIQQAEERDSGTYICTEPQSRDTARGVLNVINDLRIVVTPPIIRLRAGQTAQFQCYTVNPGRTVSYPDFFQANGGRAADNQRTTVERLEPGKVQLTFRAVTTSDNGTRFTCRHGRSMADAVVLVSPVCAAGYRLCRNAQCINSAKFCDGRYDCSDSSDEDPQFCRQCDPLSKPCKEHNGQKPTNDIYQAHWSCDGEDDCGNGYDEARCYGNVLQCGGLTHRCSDGTKTIPKAFLCDKDSDCPNGEDESKCVTPAIIPEPTSSYLVNARRGETVEFTCQVTGYPLPRIIWRFNWGCLTDENRMTVSETYQNCQTTISVLRISNFQPGDDGIYNCEGLSGGKRAWSKDYQLMMNLRN